MGLWREPKPRRRRGVYHGDLTVGVYHGDLTVGDTTHHVQYEVEEVERQAGLSRVRVLRITGTSHKRVARELLPAWIITNKIAWFPEEGK